MRLADTQAAIREAVVADRPARILAELVERGDTAYRLSIHQRHFAASLITVIRTRYPTLEWLLGSGFLNAAASRFVHEQPPVRPCMAEYGESFPEFLRSVPGTDAMPWLPDIARLEWHLGAVSVDVAHPPAGLAEMAEFDAVDLGDLSLRPQPGVAYLASDWPVDALLNLRLSGAEQENFAFNREPVFLEVRGARGDFRITRLSPGAFAFRRALAARRSLADAITAGEAAETDFDAGVALAAAFGDGLVTHIANLNDGEA